MNDYQSVKEALEASFYIRKSSNPVMESIELSPYNHVFETEEDLRTSLFLFAAKDLRDILADVLVTLLTDPDTSGIDAVVRSLVPHPENQNPQDAEEEQERFDDYDESQARAILSWLSYVRSMQWGVEEEDMNVAEAFWKGKEETFAKDSSQRTTKRIKAKQKRTRLRSATHRQQGTQ